MTSNQTYSVLGDVSNNVINNTVLSSGRPFIFFMGGRRSGKSSIERVVFDKMEPHQTLYSIQPTSEICHYIIDHNPLMQFEILDFPGFYEFQSDEVLSYDDSKTNDMQILSPPSFSSVSISISTEAELLFKHCTVLLLVIDAQDLPYSDSLKYILKLIEISHSINADIQYTMLINKIDAEAFLTAESKLHVHRLIEKTVNECLNDLNLEQEIDIEYYLTSIYDHSIFEALSKILHKLLPTPISRFLKNILTSFVNKCQIEKAFIFDIVSKLYVATDANLIDTHTISLCSDMIDVTMDVSIIYSSKTTENDDQSEEYFLENDSEIALQTNANASANVQQILVMNHVGKYLALLYLMKRPQNKGLLEFNLAVFRKAMQKLFIINHRFGYRRVRMFQNRNIFILEECFMFGKEGSIDNKEFVID